MVTRLMELKRKILYVKFKLSSEKVERLISRGGEWSFKKYGSRKILVEFHGSRSLVFFRGSEHLAVSIFSRSPLRVLISQSKKSKSLGLA